MSKRTPRKRKQSPPRRFPWLWVAAVAGALLILGGLLWSRPRSASTVTPQVSGAPRLAVDQTLVDEGDVKFDTLVRTTFRLSNVGDQPLKILGQPQVELVEGC